VNVLLLNFVDWFSQLVRAVSLAGITVKDVLSTFCRDWMSVYNLWTKSSTNPALAGR